MATISLRFLALLLSFLSWALLCTHSDYAYSDDGCVPSGKIVFASLEGDCVSADSNACCKVGEEYDNYTCSPPVTSSTEARMTLNDFTEGGSGGGPAKCDNDYHPDDEMVVALSTGWYENGARCGKNIQITSTNGNTVSAVVVDMCDSMNGCDEDHAFQKPCDNNVVDASRAVWKALGYDTDAEIWKNDLITWSDE